MTRTWSLLVALPITAALVWFSLAQDKELVVILLGALIVFTTEAALCSLLGGALAQTCFDRQPAAPKRTLLASLFLGTGAGILAGFCASTSSLTAMLLANGVTAGAVGSGIFLIATRADAEDPEYDQAPQWRSPPKT